MGNGGTNLNPDSGLDRGNVGLNLDANSCLDKLIKVRIWIRMLGRIGVMEVQI